MKTSRLWWQIEGKRWKQWQISSSWTLKSLQMMTCRHEIRRQLLLGRKAMTNLDSVLKSRDITLLAKVRIVKAVIFLVVMNRDLDHTEGRAPKNWCFQTVLLEKTPESPLDSEEIEPVNLKGNQPWILIGKTDADAEAPIFWFPDVNSWLIGRNPDAGKDWRQKEKRVSEDEVAGCYHQRYGHELG